MHLSRKQTGPTADSKVTLKHNKQHCKKSVRWGTWVTHVVPTCLILDKLPFSWLIREAVMMISTSWSCCVRIKQNVLQGFGQALSLNRLGHTGVPVWVSAASLVMCLWENRMEVLVLTLAWNMPSFRNHCWIEPGGNRTLSLLLSHFLCLSVFCHLTFQINKTLNFKIKDLPQNSRNSTKAGSICFCNCIYTNATVTQ